MVDSYQNNLCKTIPVNMLFDLGQNCLIQDKDGAMPSFTIPCNDIDSRQKLGTMLQASAYASKQSADLADKANGLG